MTYIYIFLSLAAFFSGGVYIGWAAAMAGFVESIKRGTMQEVIKDYEEAFGTPMHPKE
jgi:hypothetical protein